jgi:hypothetical protein
MNGLIPIRVWTKDGITKHQFVNKVDHATLCMAFGLSPMVTFDIPQSMIGYTGTWDSQRVIDGFILLSGEPIGRIWIARPGDQFRDLDLNDKLNKNWIK